MLSQLPAMTQHTEPGNPSSFAQELFWDGTNLLLYSYTDFPRELHQYISVQYGSAVIKLKDL